MAAEAKQEVWTWYLRHCARQKPLPKKANGPYRRREFITQVRNQVLKDQAVTALRLKHYRLEITLRRRREQEKRRAKERFRLEMDRLAVQLPTNKEALPRKPPRAKAGKSIGAI